MFEKFLKETIGQMELQGLKRELRLTDSPQSSHLMIDGRKVVNFCSNNYLGLANDSRVIDAAVECMKTEGFGSGASRLVCGNLSAHQRLEDALARFKGTERCLLFSTGYMANVGIISSLFDREDVIFSDRLNHASIIDGILLSRATMKRYAHKDMAHLERLLKEADGFRKKAIITDSVFSMDGDTAPLKEITALAKRHDCVVMIDEAHAFGVLGDKGKGLAEHLGCEKDIDIQMGTLSKAAGSFGAYCCGREDLIDFLINKARSFIYTTGMPAPVAAASCKAIEILRTEPQRREALLNNVRYMRAQLKVIGLDILGDVTPIIPIMVKDHLVAVEFSRRLLDAGILVSAVRPPTVPQNTSRLRCTVMATHSKKELDYTLNHMETIGKDLCLI